MPITLRALETRSGRLKLPVSKNPQFAPLGQGVSLGYRRTAQGPGVWVARLANGRRGVEKRVAVADDVGEADGVAVLNFSQAKAAVERLGRGGSLAEPEAPRAAVATLGDAVERYRRDLEARGGRSDNYSRLVFNLPPAMMKRPLALLDAAELRKWRDSLTNRQSPASINRLASILRSCLNRAAEADASLSARAWQIGLRALPDATQSRNTVLTEPQIRSLIAAARGQSPQFGLLVETLAVTGARISQIARCEIRDLSGDRVSIPSSAKGQRKRSSRVPVPIPAGLADRLRVFAAGRSPSAPLLVKPSGDPWSKSDHSRPFARIVEQIGEDNSIVTVYSLRHSHITAQLLAGLPVQVVAKLHDTSASQIERHYAAEIASIADSAVRATMRDLGSEAPGGDVIPLRR